jgi:aminopeptidase N
MRSKRVAAAFVTVVVAGVAGCTSGPPAPHPSLSAAVSTPSGRSASSANSPPSTMPSPGAVTSGDSIFPELGNGGYDVGHYSIAISYVPSSHRLTGTDTLTARATQALSRFDLDLHRLTVTSVTVDGMRASFVRAADKLTITPGRPLPRGADFTTAIVYGGVPVPYSDPDLGFEGFVPESDGALAQGEPQVAAGWFPVNDRPTDKATYDIRLTAPSSLAAISNGVLAGRQTAGGSTTWHWVESAPMASYLTLVAIGRYRVTMSTHGGRPVVLAVASALPKSVDAQLAETPQILDFLVSQFGPYPFDAVGGVVHDDSRIGFALENQTRPAYAPGFFAVPQDPTGTIAHELTHQWFGDSVTVGDWSDVWLNEGFATYAEWLWSEHQGHSTPKHMFDTMYNGPSGTLPTEPPAQPTEQSLFGPSAYRRGAATLEALRISVGDAAFWRIVRGWARDHAGGNVTTAQFIAYADQVSGKKLDGFFQAWLYENGKPPYPRPLG